MLKSLLEAWGYEVILAVDGEALIIPKMLKRSLLLLLLLVSLGDYVWRGLATVSRGGMNDFQDPYIGAHLWLSWHNPYDSSLVKETWIDETGNPAFNEVKTVYPPTTYLLLAPFALLHFRASLALWWLVLMGSVFTIAWIIWKQRWFGDSLLSTAVVVSLYSPFHTALHGVNCVPLVLAFALGSCLIKNEHYAGIMLATAICIKPQVAIWFVLFFLVRHKRQALISCVASGVVIAAISLAPFGMHLPQLADSYRSQYLKGFGNGSSGDYTRDKSDRLSMVNLQPALYNVIRSKSATNLVAIAAFAALLFSWTRGALRNRDELLILSSLVVVSILPIYRRTNDLGLFVLPLIWACKNYRNPLALPIGVCAALFFVPINSILARYDIYGPLSGIQSWIVLSLAILLIAAQWRQSTEESQQSGLEAQAQAPR